MRRIYKLFFILIIVLTNISSAFAYYTPAKKDCTDKEYKKTHPYECTSLTAPIISGATVLGGALALITLSANAEPSDQKNYYQPTLPTYNMVGGDIDSIHLATVANSSEYTRNFNQYNDIRLSYSIARGYTGKGTNIAILDAGLDSWHGKTVAAIASGPIAPNAKIESYKIAYEMDFIPYEDIGEIISSATTANVFNASWSVSMRATNLHSRQQLERLTSQTFVNALSNAAKQDAIFVWAAGNESNSQSSALSALPAVIPELSGHFVNVVAWDTEKGALADYSNACGITSQWCITAPGTNIKTETGTATGTSFAAPIVSAAIAVIREAFPYMTAEEITALLFETARDLGTPGIDAVYGHGMLDLERATRPVGAPLVPMTNGTMQPLQPARLSGTLAHNIEKIAPKFAYFDKYGRAFETDISNMISIQNPGIGFQRLRQNPDITVSKLGNFEFGISNSDVLLGYGFLQTAGQDLFGFIRTQNDFYIDDIRVFQRARLSFGTPKTSENSMINHFSNVYMASMDIGINFGNWTFGVSIPNTIIDGTMNMHLPIGRTDTGSILYKDYEISMYSSPSIEYSITYKSITASFVDNPYGTDEIFFLLRDKIKF